MADSLTGQRLRGYVISLKVLRAPLQSLTPYHTYPLALAQRGMRNDSHFNFERVMWRHIHDMDMKDEARPNEDSANPKNNWLAGIWKKNFSFSIFNFLIVILFNNRIIINYCNYIFYNFFSKKIKIVINII